MAQLSAYQRHMKKALKGKMKGKTKAQRKAIFKAAARSWKKKPKSSASRSRVTRSSSRSRSRKSTKSSSSGNPSRRTKVRNFLSFNKIKAWLQTIALVAPAAYTAIGPGTPQQKITTGIRKYTGFDPATGAFQWSWLLQGWGPFLGAVGVTEGVTLIRRIIRSIK